MLNEFVTNPVCVHEMDIDDTQPYIKNTLVFLGNVPNEVLAAAEQSARKMTDNKVLNSYYGSSWKTKLGFITPDVATGGDDDDPADILDLGDELDQIDLFEIDTEKEDQNEAKREIVVESDDNSKKTKSKKEKKSKPDSTNLKVFKVQKKERQARTITFLSESVFPEDKVSEFKEKIFLASGVHPYKQHIYFMLRNNAIPLRYKISIEGKTSSIDLSNAFKQGKKTIMGVPVDRAVYESRDAIKVEAYDQFFTLADIYDKYATNVFYMYNIDTFLNRQIIDELKGDNYQLELMYYSFVMEYWPMMTLDVFKVYLFNSKEMGEIYPDLAPSKNTLQDLYSAQTEILYNKYKLLEDANAGYRKNPKFRDYNPEFVTKSGIGKSLTVSIKNATLAVEKERQYVKTQFGLSISSRIQIDVRNLFDKMRITDDIPLIKVKLLRGKSPFVLTKTKDPHIVSGENISAIFEQVKYQLQMPYWNTILFAVRAKDSRGKPIPAAAGISKYIIILLFDNGKYQIKSTWSEDEQMDFKKINDILQQTTSPFIDTVNNLGRLIFASSDRLSKISQSNSEFSELSMSLFWKKTLSTGQYKKVLDELEEDFHSGIIKSKESDAGLNEYLYFKGVTGYDISQIEKYISLQNYYAYLSDANVKQKWATLFDQGRVMSFTHRTSDVKIEIQNIRETEFKYFYQYIISFLFKSDKVMPETSSSTNSFTKGAKINTLKLLKSKDPDAFVFKKFGSDVVYSRICQKDHQPIPFSADEINMLSSEERERAVKFINYTTNKDIYYLCRKGKYPYLSFITGQHPKNYCLPCCKKTPAYSSSFDNNPKSKKINESEIEEANKKERIYKSCMEKHEYVEQDEESGASRYVMNYGKDIYVGRIGKLPDAIQQYLLYNLENVDILSEFTIARTFIMNGKKYSVDRLFKITKNIKVHKVPLTELVQHLNNKTWEYKDEGVGDISPINVIENPKKNRRYTKHYNRIINADMQYPILVYNIKPDDDDTPADEKRPGAPNVIVDGLHRLSRAYIEKHPNISVRYITNKQLGKVYIMDVDGAKKDPLSAVEMTPPISQTITVRKNKKVKGNGSTDGCSECGEIVLGGAIDEKKPGYYLYGVPQNSKNVSNIGVLFSLAIALNMEFDEFITFTIKILKENPQYFQILLNGELNRYFAKMRELISLITESFLRGTFIGNSQFTRWNELFIDIARICYDKTIIIFDDTSIITTGSSMKTSAVEDVNLILPNQVRYLEDIIPSAVVKNYILLLQRRKKSKSAFEKHEKVYYPIFIFVPYMFFKAHSIEKRVYTQHDEIMKLIKSMIESSLENNTFQQVSELDFNILTEFLQTVKDATIEKLFINSKDMCYAAIVNLDAGQVYVPIKYSYYNNAELFYPKGATDEDILEYGAFDRDEFKLGAASLKNFIEKYNRFVVKKSLSLGMVKTMDAGTTEEEKILPVYPLLKMNNILVLSNNPGKIRGSEYTIIGLSDDSKHYYLNDIKHSSSSGFFKLFSSGYNVFTFDLKSLSDDSFLYLYYDPTLINNIVIADKKDVKDARSKLLGHAIYKKYLYRMFVIEFIRYFDKDRNDVLRKKIHALIKKNSFKGGLNTFRDELDKVLTEYPDDAAKIREQVNVFYNSYFDKKILLEEVKTSVYRFDRTSLVKVMDSAADYWVHSAEEQKKQHERVKEQLLKISKQFVKIGEPKKTGPINILTACESNVRDNMYCDGNRLLVPSDKYDDFVSLFTDDLLNPLKSPYIMALIFMENVIDEFQFELVPGESIYIKM